MGTIDWLGKEVAGIGTPLLAALVICFIGGAVSAFASTTGILGALIPLAVPFLAQGQIGAVGVIIALSIASSVVDSSPFSTSGALVVANSPDDKRDGFMHFSTAEQVAESARLHRAGQADLLLIVVAEDGVAPWKWEPARSGALFPHLYGELDLGAVTAILDMRARSDGYHDIPELAP